MVMGVVVAPAGNCRRTPQARVTEQPWGVTRKLSEESGMRADRQGAPCAQGDRVDRCLQATFPLIPVQI